MGGREISGFLCCYHYDTGDRTNPHFDRPFTKTVDGRMTEFTAYSMLLYLNEGFRGGETIFFESHETEERELKVKAAVVPRRGDIFVFPHGKISGCHPDPYHAGGEVTSGVKKIIRTDVTYRCVKNKNKQGRRKRREAKRLAEVADRRNDVK